MKPDIIRSAGILFLGIIMTTAINAQPMRQGGRDMHRYGTGDRQHRQYKPLELTDEQQEEMTTLRTEYFKASTPLKNKLGELKARERTLLSEENVDMKAVDQNIDEQTEVMNSMKKLQVEHQVAVKKVLTDEQLMQLQQGRQLGMRSEFRGNGGQRDPGMGRGYRGNQ